ncbi:MAG: hypothetical protein RQ743_01275 [Bacteroidales bacterium]|nr:hypothetical protein [Bacteroidales bacterium]
MMKRIFVFAVIAAIFAACGNTTGEKAAAAEEGVGIDQVTFASVVENPDQYLGKEITLEGKVVHVCMNSGKKMYIVGEDPDIRLFISAGEEVPKFPMELLGSEISVTGVFQKIETGAEMEKEHVATEEGEECETEAAIAAQPVLADMMLNYKNHTVK